LPGPFPPRARATPMPSHADHGFVDMVRPRRACAEGVISGTIYHDGNKSSFRSTTSRSTRPTLLPTSGVSVEPRREQQATTNGSAFTNSTTLGGRISSARKWESRQPSNNCPLRSRKRSRRRVTCDDRRQHRHSRAQIPYRRASVGIFRSCDRDVDNLASAARRRGLAAAAPRYFDDA